MLRLMLLLLKMIWRSLIKEDQVLEDQGEVFKEILSIVGLTVLFHTELILDLMQRKLLSLMKYKHLIILYI